MPVFLQCRCRGAPILPDSGHQLQQGAGGFVAKCASLLALLQPAHAADKPKLILQIPIDQLRGDLPSRYYERLGKGGFRYLWESGVVYRNWGSSLRPALLAFHS